MIMNLYEGDEEEKVRSMLSHNLPEVQAEKIHIHFQKAHGNQWLHSNKITPSYTFFSMQSAIINKFPEVIRFSSYAFIQK